MRQMWHSHLLPEDRAVLPSVAAMQSWMFSSQRVFILFQTLYCNDCKQQPRLHLSGLGNTLGLVYLF